MEKKYKNNNEFTIGTREVDNIYNICVSAIT